MANIFPRWSNTLAPKAIFFGGLVGTTVVLGVWYYFTPKYTRVGYMPTQPVPFQHSIHVQQLGMDCRYCHSYVEVSSHSNVPSTQTCMNCHTAIKGQSPKLQPVRDSWQSGKPVEWVRIHRVPDYAYFNHSAHVNRGVSCVSCHGKINEMEVVWEDQSLGMAFCLNCHRNVENYLRPLSEITHLDWKPEDLGTNPDTGKPWTQLEIGTKLKHDWNVQPKVTCNTCHR
ncbi:MAG: cytochrome c3 family protein [Rhodospirillales bacterium]|nr:cytochrome c3 family protein [Acetobacter sp.]